MVKTVTKQRQFAPALLIIISVGCLVGVATGPATAADSDAPKRVLLLHQGPDGHPEASHEFEAGCRVLAACLAHAKSVAVERAAADEPWPDGPAALAEADGVVLYLTQGATWATADPRRYEALTQLAARRGGVVALHWAIGSKDPAPLDRFVQLIGGCHGGPDRKYTVTEALLQIPNAEHPIVRGIAPLRVRDEFYYNLKWALPLAGGGPAYASAASPPSPSTVQPLVQVDIDGAAQTVGWAWERPDGGRSCGFALLHFHDNWRRPEYRRLVTQAVLWSVGVEIPQDGADVDVPEDVFTLH